MHLLAAILAGLLALSHGQVIDPSSVDLATRQYWCTEQKSSCPLICLQLKGSEAGTISNTCYPRTLAWTCVCANGQSPNISQYSQTIPYFECVTSNDQCVNNCGIGDNGCAAACQQDSPCGAQDPKHVKVTTTSTTAKETKTPGAPLTNNVGVTTGHVPTKTAPVQQSLNGNNNAGSSGGGNAAAGLVVCLGSVYGSALLALAVVGGFAWGL